MAKNRPSPDLAIKKQHPSYITVLRMNGSKYLLMIPLSSPTNVGVGGGHLETFIDETPEIWIEFGRGHTYYRMDRSQLRSSLV